MKTGKKGIANKKKEEDRQKKKNMRAEIYMSHKK